MAVWMAKRRGLTNFSVLVSHVLVPPAMTAILDAPDNRVQAFLGPGHVCTVVGYEEYEPIARAYSVPIVITGFEPVDMLEGLYQAVRQLEDGRAEIENAYGRAVRRDGNPASRALIDEVFEVCDRKWRGVGEIPQERSAAPRRLSRVRRRTPIRRCRPSRRTSRASASAATSCAA